MSEYRRFLDVQQIEQTGRILRQEIETVVNVWLRRLSETDLVRNNYPETPVREKLDGFRPVGTPKVLSVQQDNRPAVRVFGRLDIHKAHSKILTFGEQIQVRCRIGIFQPFVTGPKRLFIFFRKRLSLGPDICEHQSGRGDSS